MLTTTLAENHRRRLNRSRNVRGPAKRSGRSQPLMADSLHLQHSCSFQRPACEKETRRRYGVQAFFPPRFPCIWPDLCVRTNIIARAHRPRLFHQPALIALTLSASKSSTIPTMPLGSTATVSPFKRIPQATSFSSFRARPAPLFISLVTLLFLLYTHGCAGPSRRAILVIACPAFVIFCFSAAESACYTPSVVRWLFCVFCCCS